MSARILLAAAAAAALAAAAWAAGPTYKITGTIAGNDGGWDYATFDPALRRVYVSHADSVFAVDVDTGKVTEKLGDAPHDHKIVPLDGGHVIAVTTGGDNTLRFIDAGSGAALGSVPTGVGPDSAWFEPVSGLVLVAAHRAGEVDLVDPKTKKSVGAITVGGALEELASDPEGHVFVNVEDKGEIVELNLKTKSVVRRTKMEGCEGPTGLVYAPHVHALFAACEEKTAVVSARTLKVEKMLATAKGPDGALYDPARGLVIIPGGQSGEISVIDAKTAGKVEVIGTYPTEKSARLGALDPKTGKIYLPAARFQPPAPGQRRGSMEPGSFHLVVVSPSS
jgi:DNA-binding beta-propeller fold protein YncE